MKRFIRSQSGFTLVELLIVTILLLIFIGIPGLICTGGCGEDKRVCYEKDDKEVCHTFEQYGLIDSGKLENPNVEYDVVVGNVIWSILLVKTIAVPVILVGWYLYEPVGPKNKDLTGIPGAKD